MRLTTFFEASRRPQLLHRIPLKPTLPMTVPTKVPSRKGVDGQHCLQEVTLLLACFQKNEFDEKICAPEIAAFQKCAEHTHQMVQADKILRKSGEVPPGTRKLTSTQMNEYLKRYPVL